MKKILLFFTAGLVLFGCKTEHTPGDYYSGDDYAYIVRITNQQWPSLPQYHSCEWRGVPGTNQNPTINQTQFTLTVSAVGNVDSENDRPFELEYYTDEFWPLAPQETYTLEGDLFIPKGKGTTDLTLTLINNVEFFKANKGGRWRLYIRVKGNDNFKVWPVITNYAEIIVRSDYVE